MKPKYENCNKIQHLNLKHMQGSDVNHETKTEPNGQKPQIKK
jgi:hypothetical protein